MSYMLEHSLQSDSVGSVFCYSALETVKSPPVVATLLTLTVKVTLLEDFILFAILSEAYNIRSSSFPLS